MADRVTELMAQAHDEGRDLEWVIAQLIAEGTPESIAREMVTVEADTTEPGVKA